MPDTTPHPWWVDPVIYQIYPRSFADANGDGSGDLRGIIDHLDYLVELGVDGFWLSPCFVSPQRDGGYDVADYRHIDPLYGTDQDMDDLIAAAHARDLRVILDLVPNHTSDQHEWFQAALAAGPGSPQRSRYWFVEEDQINNWNSIFGGPAWTRVCDRPDAPGSPWEHDTQYYLHLFDPSQPDLNWEHADVRTEFCSILEYWFERGVDGFRIDVVHGMAKTPGLPDLAEAAGMLESAQSDPRFDCDDVHPILREWNEIAARYDGALIGELWVDDPVRRQRYLRPDELHCAFAFDYLLSSWDAPALARVISANALGPSPLKSAWVLSNHDSVRHISRFGLAEPNRRPNGIGPGDEQPDYRTGWRLARAATMLMLALPGSAYLYQGEELGLPDHCGLTPDQRLDPTFFRSEGAELGRDGCRIPLPWDAAAPNFGFSAQAGARTWLPQPATYANFAAATQLDDPDSMFAFYRRLLALRRRRCLGQTELKWVTPDHPDVIVFDLAGLDRAGAATVTRVVLVPNPGATYRLAGEYQLLATSDPSFTEPTLGPDTAIPGGTCLWLAPTR